MLAYTKALKEKGIDEGHARIIETLLKKERRQKK